MSIVFDPFSSIQNAHTRTLTANLVYFFLLNFINSKRTNTSQQSNALCLSRLFTTN